MLQFTYCGRALRVQREAIVGYYAVSKSRSDGTWLLLAPGDRLGVSETFEEVQKKLEGVLL